MDKYTKNILTIIALGIVGINIQMLTDKIITPSKAASVQQVEICNYNGSKCANISGIGFGDGKLSVDAN
jgi:hypothetical protein